MLADTPWSSARLEFQSGNLSPLMPVNSAWRFAVGGQQQLSRTSCWGIAGAYAYGGSLDTSLQSAAPVALGGRGDLIGLVRQHGHDPPVRVP